MRGAVHSTFRVVNWICEEEVTGDLEWSETVFDDIWFGSEREQVSELCWTRRITSSYLTFVSERLLLDEQ